MGTTFSSWSRLGEDTAPTFHLWDGTTEKAVSSISYMPKGRTVNQIELPLYNSSIRPSMIAHRCGSDDWAEMSLRGATESVYRGVDGLEFSFQVSSDGVYFGLHDATLDRTVPGLTSATAANMTWAQIRRYAQKAGADTAFGAQPFMKLTDFLNIYAKTHTVFLDPKNVPAAQYSSLVSLFNTYPNAQDHIVGKAFCTTTTWGNAMQNAGYKTWGYYYSADVNTANRVSTTAPYWTWLGMDYGAPQADWNTLMNNSAATGKLVLGHIAPNQAAVTTALNYGAHGMMVSGIRNVMPTYY